VKTWEKVQASVKRHKVSSFGRIWCGSDDSYSTLNWEEVTCIQCCLKVKQIIESMFSRPEARAATISRSWRVREALLLDREQEDIGVMKRLKELLPPIDDS
jgi:hypothetical protein